MLRKSIIPIIITFFLALVVQSLTVRSEPVLPKAAFNEVQEFHCEETTDLSKMTACTMKAYRVLEKKVNETLMLLKNEGLSAQENKLLTHTQASWIRFRDTYCDFAAYAVKNEPGYTFHKYDCLRRLTEQHLTNLKEYFEDLDI